jgi:alkylhydroperoxidase family enzyme
LNAAGGSENGATDSEIQACLDGIDHASFSEDDRAALALAAALTETPPLMTDDLYADARAHFSEAELVEIGAIIALENFRARFNRLFDVPPVGRYCPVPSASWEHQPSS